MPADDLAVSGTDFYQSCFVHLAVRDIPGEPHDLFALCAGRLDNSADTGECLTNLRHEIRRELAGFVPADLTGQEQEAVLDNAVRIPARTLPAGRIDNLHGTAVSRSRRRKRCTLPEALRGSASRKSTTRGYL